LVNISQPQFFEHFLSERGSEFVQRCVLTTIRRNRYPGAMDEVTPEAIVVSVTELWPEGQGVAKTFRSKQKWLRLGRFS
jgi:hypothetical protein